MTSYQYSRGHVVDIDRVQAERFLSYSPETGAFTRLSVGSKRHAANVGKPCGHLNKALGYVTIHLCGRNHFAHRLAWIMVHGSIPSGYMIDHANRDKSDNRICNLRLATHADNLRNSKTRPDNTSGVKGVHYDRARGKWKVSVGRRCVGRFETMAEAIDARRSAAMEAFGSFANEGATPHLASASLAA